MVETASTGYLPAADSADSMMASAPSKTAVATSETSARVGTGAWIIDSSIWVAITTGLPARRASRVICFCRPGTRSSGSSTPRSPRATISASEASMMSGEAVDRLRLLDLGHDGGAAADHLLGLDDVFGALHERQRDPVDAGGQRRLEIGPVLRRHRRNRQVGIRQADALAVGHAPADHDAGDGALRRGLFRDQPHLAVVEQQRMPGPQRGEDLRMRKLHARAVARRLVGIQHEALAVLQLDRAVRERPEPQLRPLQVDQDADRPAIAAISTLRMVGHQLPHLVMRRMAHIDAENVGARLEQAADHRALRRGWPEGREDLDAAQAPHGLLPGVAAGGRPDAPGGAAPGEDLAGPARCRRARPFPECPGTRCCAGCSLDSVSWTVQAR